MNIRAAIFFTALAFSVVFLRKEYMFLRMSLLIFTIGMWCNVLVVNLNNNKMPVLCHDVYMAMGVLIYCPGYKPFFTPENIKLWVLSDVLYMGNNIYSIGDLLLYTGIWCAFFSTVFYMIKDIKNNEN